LVLVMVITLSLMSYIKGIDTNKPIPTPTPSASFGTLPSVTFPESVSRPATFKLELIEGKPPEATASAPIYLIPDKKPTLFSRRQGVTFGKKLGFMEEPTEFSPTILEFTDPETNSSLTLNIATNNFHMKRNYPDLSSFQNTIVANESVITGLARTYFRDLRVWNDLLSQEEVTYYTYDGQNLAIVDDVRVAQVVRVDFMTPVIGPYAAVTPNKTFSNIYLIFNVDQNKIGNIIEASFQYFPPNISISATYPTISGQDAWDQLVQGKGYIGISKTDQAIIRKVYLAYYLAPEYMPFLQLVWVFEGDNEFFAIIPAISAEWIGQ